MKANLFGLTLVVILTIQTCQSLETETSEERRAKCKYRVHRQWCFAYFFYNLFILLSVLPIFQVIRFPVSIFLNTYVVCTTKKSRKFLIFLSFFRMMAAQVPIEMVLAIQGKCLYKNDRFKNVMYLINLLCFILRLFQRRMFLKRWNLRWLLCQWIWGLLCLYASKYTILLKT